MNFYLVRLTSLGKQQFFHKHYLFDYLNYHSSIATLECSLLRKKARRALKGNNPKPEKAFDKLEEGLALLEQETAWRKRASIELSATLKLYDESLKNSIGLRKQNRMTDEQAKFVAACKSSHQDISLHF